MNWLAAYLVEHRLIVVARKKNNRGDLTVREVVNA